MRAPTPEYQAERLDDLEGYRILDTEPEQGFDDIVELVRSICEVPIALVSFVAKDRQWFKARQGLDMPETPIEQSICAHTILGRDILEIPDTLKDRRTADNPLCNGERDTLRFYAGAPLITARGNALGSLCVLDRTPRKLDDKQRKALKLIAAQVMRQLELRRSLENEQTLSKEIDHRVKNSLQTVRSFVRLYTNRATQPETREALDAIARRVDAISQLHAELYQTSAFDTVRLDSYLTRVIDLLSSSLASNVSVDADIAAVSTDNRTAASLAVIVAEFAANSNKHAFPDGRIGRIRIRLEQLEGGALRLSCEDDGVGDQAAQVPQADSIASIGLKLIESAASQIEADMALERENGYRLVLTMPPLVPPQPFQAGVLSTG